MLWSCRYNEQYLRGVACMSKQEKQAKTLLEYMGFKDEDHKSVTHDKIQSFLLETSNLKEIIRCDEILAKYVEVPLSNKFHYYGFLDMVVITNNITFCIEIKTTPPSTGQLLREIHYYEDVIDRLLNESFKRFVFEFKGNSWSGWQRDYSDIKKDNQYHPNPYHTEPKVGKCEFEDFGNYEFIIIGDVPNIQEFKIITINDLNKFGFNQFGVSQV